MLETPIAEERRGRPGAARDAALAAAADEPALAPWHLLDAACASLVAGEPRAAVRLLGRIGERGDEQLARQAHACRYWASRLDRNWYPGDVGAEIGDDVLVSAVAPPTPAPGDTATVVLEVVAAWGPPELLSIRAMVPQLNRSSPTAARELVDAAVGQLARLAALLGQAGAPGGAAWAQLALADLLRRAGRRADADAALASARGSAPDAVARAVSHLMEGDWWAVPGSSPEALGLDLEAAVGLPVAPEGRDAERAARAYDEAGALLAGADAPRADGALALRRAALAWQAEDTAAQREQLDAAERSFAAAGDAAAARVVAVHRLLGALEAGDIAATRRSAGTGWNLAARGEVAALLDWAREDGSISFSAGLGRLLQRTAARWEGVADERAAAAYVMALPLIAVNGAVARAEVLGELAHLDGQRGLAVRAAVRAQQALADLPPVQDALEQRLEWMRHVNAAMGVLGGYAAGARIDQSGTGLRRAIDHIRALLELPGVPDGTDEPSVDPAVLQELARAREHDDLERLLADAELDITGGERRMLAVTAATARAQLEESEAMLALGYARSAQSVGAEATAHRWYGTALEKARDRSWIAALVLSSRGDLDEAQALVATLRRDGGMAAEMLAPLALRVRDAKAARDLYAQAGAATTWPDLADRAETALECGDPEQALALAGRAIDQAESVIGRLVRDPDRVAACDDVRLTALHLVAARAALAVFEHAHDGDVLARGYAITERARGLALLSLMHDLTAEAADAPLARRWQRIATEWQVAHDRLHSAYVMGRPQTEIADRLDVLNDAETALLDVEAEVEVEAPRALASARRLPSSAGLADVQAALPRGVALLEYHALGRDLQVWAVTAGSAEGRGLRVAPFELPSLVHRVLEACKTGSPGAEAADLADLILEPVAGVLEACERVVIVPFGPLTALPFGVLPFRRDALGASHVLSYVPAASLLAARRIDPRVGGATTAIVGDPAFDAAAHPGLPRLPGAAVEARAVARRHDDPTPLIGPGARQSDVTARLAEASLVHLAAHGRLDSVAPSASSIVLAGRDELTVADLIGLRMQAEIAVLSACDSGRGTVSLGGDVTGLARGLLAAGVARAVVSLWPVDDVAACVTMAAFHEHLTDAPPAHALARAQADVRGLSGEALLGRYVELGGTVDPGAPAVRRGVRNAAPELPWDPEFEDVLEEGDDGTALEGGLARVWAPFVLIGG